MRPFAFLLLLLAFSFSGCLKIQNPHSSLAPGLWRATLQLEPKPNLVNKKGEPLPELMDIQLEDVTQGELPFLMNVVYNENNAIHIEIINGEERIKITDVQIGLDRQTAKDTLLIEFPVFDSYIKAIFEGKIIEGEWVVNNRKDYRIPFSAVHGQDHRFTTLKKKPIMDISGNWEATFEVDTDNPFKAIAQFKQNGNHLSGTFTTETGDYRFLEGTVQEDKFYLSTFDGAHAFLFEGKILPDSILLGSFRSGKHYKVLWEARKNPTFSLPSPDSLTPLNSDRFELSIKNKKGEIITLEDPQYAGKAKLIYLMGTWCPNCRDATRFISQYLTNIPEGKLSVLGLAFEKYREPEKAWAAVERYQQKMNVKYDILLAGYASKKEAADLFPELEKVIAYPTMVFLDKENKIQKVYTGFYGPATAEHENFKKDFDQFVQSLIQ